MPGVMKTDPVCGASIDPLRARAVAIVNGERYYFCSAEHRNQFQATTARYLVESPAPAAPPSAVPPSATPPSAAPPPAVEAPPPAVEAPPGEPAVLIATPPAAVSPTPVAAPRAVDAPPPVAPA